MMMMMMVAAAEKVGGQNFQAPEMLFHFTLIKLLIRVCVCMYVEREICKEAFSAEIKIHRVKLFKRVVAEKLKFLLELKVNSNFHKFLLIIQPLLGEFSSSCGAKNSWLLFAVRLTQKDSFLCTDTLSSNWKAYSH